MKKEVKLVIYGFLSILTLDILGSIASKQFNFHYSLLTPIALSVYVYFSYKFSQISNLKKTAFLTGLLGLYDGTIGFIISQKLNANTGTIKMSLTFTTILSTAIFMFFLTYIIGVLVWFIKSKLLKNQ